MPFLPPNQQRQSTEGTACHVKSPGSKKRYSVYLLEIGQAGFVDTITV